MNPRRAIFGAIILAAIGSGVFLTMVQSPRIDAKSRDPNPGVRANAVRGLQVTSDADRLISCLKDDDSDVRLLSAMRLGERPNGIPAMGAELWAPALIDALKDRHAGVRRAAAESLGQLWPATENALTGALANSDPRVRAGAAFALSWANDDRAGRQVTAAQAEPLRPLLRGLLNDESAEVRHNATRALERIR
jgi:HEAT repeat protein